MAANEPTGSLKEEVCASRKRWRNLTHPTDKRRREQHSSSEEFKGRSFEIHFQIQVLKENVTFHKHSLLPVSLQIQSKHILAQSPFRNVDCGTTAATSGEVLGAIIWFSYTVLQLSVTPDAGFSHCSIRYKTDWYSTGSVLDKWRYTETVGRDQASTVGVSPAGGHFYQDRPADSWCCSAGQTEGNCQMRIQATKMFMIFRKTSGPLPLKTSEVQDSCCRKHSTKNLEMRGIIVQEA